MLRQIVIEVLLLLATGGGAYFYGRHEQNGIDENKIAALTSQANIEKQKIQDQLLDVQAHVLADNQLKEQEQKKHEDEVNQLKTKLAQESHNYELLRGRLLVTRPQASTVSGNPSAASGSGSAKSTAPATQIDASGNVTGLDIAGFALWAGEAYNKWQACISQYNELEKAYAQQK
jgi:hypothetical protein